MLVGLIRLQLADDRKQYHKDTEGCRLKLVRPTLTGWRGATSLMLYLGFPHLPASLFPRFYRMVPIPNSGKTQGFLSVQFRLTSKVGTEASRTQPEGRGCTRAVSEPGAATMIIAAPRLGLAHCSWKGWEPDPVGRVGKPSLLHLGVALSQP